MKKIFFLALVLLSIGVNAQVSQMGINYQCQIRNNSGVIIPDTTVTLRFTLLPGQFSTIPTWQETSTVKTDKYGIASVIIGQGTRTSNSTVATFSQVDFSSANYYITVEIGSGNNFAQLGTKEPFQSVPYAKVAGNSLFPAGFIMPFAGDVTQIPAGWLLCNGAAISRSAYSALYSVIQGNWGTGDGTTTFNLPDLRGMFLRGVNGSTSNDPDAASRTAINTGGNIGNNVGSYEADVFASHNHSINDPGHAHTSTDYYNGTYTGKIQRDGSDISINTGLVSTGRGTSSNLTGISINNNGGNETRPKNVYVNYLIKY